MSMVYKINLVHVDFILVLKASGYNVETISQLSHNKCMSTINFSPCRDQCEELRGIKVHRHLQQVTKDRAEQLRLKEEEKKRDEKRKRVC